MYLEDEGHQISNRIIVNMNIEAEVEKIISKGHRSDLTPEVWAIGEKLNFDQLTTFVTLLLKKIGENGTSLALNEDNSVSYFSYYHFSKYHYKQSINRVLVTYWTENPNGQERSKIKCSSNQYW